MDSTNNQIEDGRKLTEDVIFAVIPAHDEEKNISGVIEGTKRYVNQVIVVDDGSSDLTAEVSRQKGAVVLRHVINMGKGAALKTGCDYAVKKGAEIIVVLDSDGQHDPEEIPSFMRAIKEGNDIVFGYRKMDKSVPFVLKSGNRLINLATRLLFKMKMHDTQSGFRVFTSEAYKKIRWRAQDYSIESEVVANTGKKNLKYREIPIKTIYTDSYKGTTILDGLKIVANMFWWRISK